jgi:hypothetical protein
MQSIRSVVHSGQRNLYCTRAANESLVIKAIFFPLRAKCSAFVVAQVAENIFFSAEYQSCLNAGLSALQRGQSM